MTRLHLSASIAALALGSNIAYAMADTGGGGAPLTLEAALARLDASVDTDWNRGGQPDLKRLKELTGSEVTRDQAVAAAPNLDRASRAKEVPLKATETPAPASTAAAPAPSDEAPAWARALFESNEQIARQLNEISERNIDLQSQLDDVRDAGSRVPDGVDLAANPELEAAARVRDELPAAPTPMASNYPLGDSLGVATARHTREELRIKKRWPKFTGKAYSGPVTAFAIGQYPAQPGKLRRVGETFEVTNVVPGSWFMPANHPDVPLYISGELGQRDAEEFWGLSVTESHIG